MPRDNVDSATFARVVGGSWSLIWTRWVRDAARSAVRGSGLRSARQLGCLGKESVELFVGDRGVGQHLVDDGGWILPIMLGSIS